VSPFSHQRPARAIAGKRHHPTSTRPGAVLPSLAHRRTQVAEGMFGATSSHRLGQLAGAAPSRRRSSTQSRSQRNGGGLAVRPSFLGPHRTNEVLPPPRLRSLSLRSRRWSLSTLRDRRETRSPRSSLRLRPKGHRPTDLMAEDREPPLAADRSARHTVGASACSAIPTPSLSRIRGLMFFRRRRRSLSDQEKPI
jgi:hypothetical protein